MSVSNGERRTVLVCDPTAEQSTGQDQPARRLATLEGKVVGLLDNSKALVDTLLHEVQGLLRKEFPGARFRYFRKPSVSGAAADLLEQLAHCDAVVTAVGD